MEEETKEELKTAGIITSVFLVIFIIFGIFAGIGYLIIKFHWAFGFLIFPLIFIISYLFIKFLGTEGIRNC